MDVPLRAAGSPGPAPAAAEVTVEGVVRTLATDRVAELTATPSDPAADAAGEYRRLLQVGSRSYDLTGVAGPTNGPVRATGVIVGDEFRASSVVTTGSVANAPASGNTRILVMLAYWTQPDSMTPAAAADQMFVDSDRWYREVSYGRLSQSGDVTPWMQIAGPTTGCYGDRDVLMSQATAAAAARGYTPGTYGNLVLYFPFCGGDAAGYAGWAYVGTTGTWLNGYLDRRVTTHELGHNLGLWHAHSYLCSGGGLAGTCSFSDYGDDYDAMGASGYVGHFSAPEKARLGWLDGRLVDLSSGGTVTLAPMSAAAPGLPQAAVVSVPGGRQYWLEFRRPTGFDALLPSEATDGVLVHVTGPGSGSPDTGSSLMDVSPGDGIGVGTATLKSGQTWTSPDGIRIAVGQLSGTGVTVTAGPVTAATAPGAVTAFALTRDDAAGSATITWAPPVSDGGSPVTGYRVSRTGVDLGGGGPWSTVVAASARSQTFTGLRPGDSYTLGVEAINAVGTGPFQGAATQLGVLPGVPTAFAVTTDPAARSATISWAPPTSAGSAPVTGYRVSRSGTDSSGSGPWSTTLPATARRQTFGLLVPGTGYTLTVQAVTTVGAGPTAGGTALIRTMPTVPGGISVVRDVAARSATLSWTPPAATGGSAITGYRITRTGINSAGSPSWTTTLPATARSQTFTMLVPGTAYTFTVAALNAVGAGPAGTATTTLTATPGVPTSVAVGKNATARSATLTWAPPASSGSSAVTGYRITRTGLNSAGSASWTTNLPATARSQTVTMLVPGTTYTLTVQALNAAGAGTAAKVTVTLP